VAGLSALRAGLAADRALVEQRGNDLESARSLARQMRAALVARLVQVRTAAVHYWSGVQGGAIGAAAPDVPGESAQWTHVERALDDIHDIWSRINSAGTVPAGAAQPLLLLTEPTASEPNPPPYSLSDFEEELAALKVQHAALGPAETRLRNARSARNVRQDAIRPWLVDYRAAVPGALPPGHALLGTVPRYSPLPGATPDAAEATGAWNPASSQATLHFTPSTSASVVRHELRYVAGEDYDADDETIVGSVDVSGEPVFHTLAGLGAPGVTASYRIYAITADGNERASNTVVITRPA